VSDSSQEELMMMNELARYEPKMRAVFRMAMGALFLLHGTMKVFGWPESANPMPPFDPTTQMGIAGIIEVAGGMAIIMGLFTRPIALILAGEMAVAYLMVHAPQSQFPMFNGGEPAVLFGFAWLYLFIAGAGAWSMDSVISQAMNARFIRMERRVQLRRHSDEPEPARVRS
jgi:putative oxidoreductase